MTTSLSAECCRDREIDGMRLDDILAVSAAHQLVALGVCIESHPPYRYPFPKGQRMPQRQ